MQFFEVPEQVVVRCAERDVQILHCCAWQENRPRHPAGLKKTRVCHNSDCCPRHQIFRFLAIRKNVGFRKTTSRNEEVPTKKLVVLPRSPPKNGGFLWKVFDKGFRLWSQQWLVTRVVAKTGYRIIGLGGAKGWRRLLARGWKCKTGKRQIRSGKGGERDRRGWAGHTGGRGGWAAARRSLNASDAVLCFLSTRAADCARVCMPTCMRAHMQHGSLQCL